jgi:predicted DNA-binding transcriptional regulator
MFVGVKHLHDNLAYSWALMYTHAVDVSRSTLRKVRGSMARINEIDRQVLGVLTGGDKIKALLAARGLNLKEFAQKHGVWVQEVSFCIRGERPMPEIREKLAAELEMDRAAIDSLIDGKAVA